MPNHPWFWGKILKIRYLFQDRYKVHVHSGLQTFFWFDNWSSLGVLWSALSEDEKRSLQVSINQSVRSAGADIRWPRERRMTANLNKLKEELEHLVWTEEKDEWMWEGKATFCQRDVWNDIRNKAPKITWFKWMWTSYSIPRHSFICWLAIHRKLSTKDRLARWGIEVDQKCVFCNNNESHNHLFFQCHYSACIWRVLLQKSGRYRAAEDWDFEAQWCIDHLAGRSFPKRIMQIATMSAIYSIWEERNRRVHGELGRDWNTIAFKIASTIQSRAASWRRIPRNMENWRIALDWGISMNIFV